MIQQFVASDKPILVHKVCAPSWLMSTLRPLPTTGGVPAGALADGFAPHFSYELRRGDDARTNGLEELATAALGPSAVAFDAGSHMLAYPGALYLVGGAGAWELEHYIFPVDPRPHWHFLRQHVDGSVSPQTFIVPALHSLVGVQTPTAVAVDTFGTTINLDNNPIPLQGELIVRSKVVLFTGWWG